MNTDYIEIGDLVCFNSAGMRKHSIGIIIDRCIRTDVGVRGVNVFYKIQWAKRPSLEPREEWGNPKEPHFNWNHSSKKQGWYRSGHWFEKI